MCEGGWQKVLVPPLNINPNEEQFGMAEQSSFDVSLSSLSLCLVVRSFSPRSFVLASRPARLIALWQCSTRSSISPLSSIWPVFPLPSIYSDFGVTPSPTPLIPHPRRNTSSTSCPILQRPRSILLSSQRKRRPCRSSCPYLRHRFHFCQVRFRGRGGLEA